MYCNQVISVTGIKKPKDIKTYFIFDVTSVK